MHRYLSAGRRLLADCQVLSLTCDATRLGGREVFAIALGGRAAGGEYITAWAPPQVLGLAAISMTTIAKKVCLENPLREIPFGMKTTEFLSSGCCCLQQCLKTIQMLLFHGISFQKEIPAKEMVLLGGAVSL